MTTSTVYESSSKRPTKENQQNRSSVKNIWKNAQNFGLFVCYSTNHINSSCETKACAINVSGCDDDSGSLGNKNWFRRIARLSTVYEWCQNKREDEFHEWNCVAIFIIEWKTDAYRKRKEK